MIITNPQMITWYFVRLPENNEAIEPNAKIVIKINQSDILYYPP